MDGSVYGTLSAWGGQEIPISRTGNDECPEIHDGKADVTEADCPDKLCVHQKAISKTHETIVCLPNKVVVEVTGEGERSSTPLRDKKKRHTSVYIWRLP